LQSPILELLEMAKKYSAGVLISDNKILLGLRSKNRKFYPNVWDFIGGHCEENECFEEAMKRELFEELNILAIEYEQILVIDRQPDFIFNLFEVTKWTGNLTNIDKAENEKINWFTFAETRELKFPESEYLEMLNTIEQNCSETKATNR
jgi:8-oxo-dGTP diphosphatase